MEKTDLMKALRFFNKSFQVDAIKSAEKISLFMGKKIDRIFSDFIKYVFNSDDIRNLSKTSLNQLSAAQIRLIRQTINNAKTAFEIDSKLNELYYDLLLKIKAEKECLYKAAIKYKIEGYKKIYSLGFEFQNTITKEELQELELLTDNSGFTYASKLSLIFEAMKSKLIATFYHEIETSNLFNQARTNCELRIETMAAGKQKEINGFLSGYFLKIHNLANKHLQSFDILKISE